MAKKTKIRCPRPEPTYRMKKQPARNIVGVIPAAPGYTIATASLHDNNWGHEMYFATDVVIAWSVDKNGATHPVTLRNIEHWYRNNGTHYATCVVGPDGKADHFGTLKEWEDRQKSDYEHETGRNVFVYPSDGEFSDEEAVTDYIWDQ